MIKHEFNPELWVKAQEKMEPALIGIQGFFTPAEGVPKRENDTDPIDPHGVYFVNDTLLKKTIWAYKSETPEHLKTGETEMVRFIAQVRARLTWDHYVKISGNFLIVEKPTNPKGPGGGKANSVEKPKPLLKLVA